MTSPNKNCIVLVVGQFGSGKTSIINAYEHIPTEDGVTTCVEGFLSVGGKRGADDFRMYGKSKKEWYNEIDTSKDYIIHGRVFSNFVDLLRYRQTHRLMLVVLKNTYDELRKRVMLRNEHSNFNPKKYIGIENWLTRLIAFSEFMKDIEIVVTDNDRPLAVVSDEVWTQIKKFQKKVV